MIRVGIIGYNEGNGHPYSFSAIINGYDKQKMSRSRYPVIYNYLTKRNPSEFGIGDLRVTHVWTPYPSISREIADCTHIEHIVDSFDKFIGQVDAVIIVRDDVESHYDIARFFLDRGLFVFVDKPLSVSEEEISYYRPFIEKARLMSCSGLRYKPEIETYFNGTLKTEDICFINAYSVLDWYKYGIHVLEGVTPLLGSNITAVEHLNDSLNYLVKISYAGGKYLLIQINKHYGWGIRADIFTKNDVFRVNFDDNFTCFKRTLQEFHKMIVTGRSAIPVDETVSILHAIMALKTEFNGKLI